MNDFDVIVLGGGSPGEHCASELAEGGLRVAVVERDLVGGECSYFACIPSKTLLRFGEVVQHAHEAGVHAEIDVAAALAWRDYMVSDYDDTRAADWLAGKGINLIRGTGRLAGPGIVEVDGRHYTADHIVLATGSDPIVPPVPGLAGLPGLWTNREATGLTSVPRRLIVLGGGPVGVEMAQAIRRFGSEVVLVGSGSHLLPREPLALGTGLAEALRADGIEVVLGVRAVAAEREGEEYVLTLDDGSERRGDRLLVATGRRPRVEDIGLETVGIATCADGIAVDASLRVAEGLWAIGDATGIRLLTHVGKYQAEIVACNILGEPREADYRATPNVVYTDPQAASVGNVEDRFSATVQLANVAKTATFTRSYAEAPGFLTLLSDGERLTGAYALGPEAGEWLQQATLAIRARVPLRVLRDVIQPFPTFSEVFVAGLKELRGKITAARVPILLPRRSASDGDPR